ncbi:hypothetical protein FRC07_004321, partial [Ceratobasidium sp. 392]
MLREFVWNSFFRRVSPVETLEYALIQNIFALGVISLLITRMIFLLSDLKNKDFLTRTGVQANCWNEDQRTSVLI